MAATSSMPLNGEFKHAHFVVPAFDPNQGFDFDDTDHDLFHGAVTPGMGPSMNIFELCDGVNLPRKAPDFLPPAFATDIAVDSKDGTRKEFGLVTPPESTRVKYELLAIDQS
ncbi:hypothetical protein LTR29_018234 [Friedmanniomyces endolithicus]|nr:hypothetical protein LTR29_018234 [Friedmanniomyces endolithicus]